MNFPQNVCRKIQYLSLTFSCNEGKQMSNSKKECCIVTCEFSLGQAASSHEWLLVPNLTFQPCCEVKNVFEPLYIIQSFCINFFKCLLQNNVTCVSIVKGLMVSLSQNCSTLSSTLCHAKVALRYPSMFYMSTFGLLFIQLF